MEYLSELSKGKNDPHFQPSTGASKKVARNMQMSWHSIVDYVPLHMHAKPHTRTLSINEDIRGGHNVPPPGSTTPKKGWW